MHRYTGHRIYHLNIYLYSKTGWHKRHKKRGNKTAAGRDTYTKVSQMKNKAVHFFNAHFQRCSGDTQGPLEASTRPELHVFVLLCLFCYLTLDCFYNVIVTFYQCLLHIELPVKYYFCLSKENKEGSDKC